MVYSNGYYTFSLGLQKTDSVILDDMCRIMGYKRPVSFSNYFDKRTGKYYWRASLIIRDQEACKDLIRFGVTPRKTFDLKFPLFLSDNLKWSFIRGLFDSDGHIEKRGYQYSIIGTNSICNGVFEIFSENNIASKVINLNRYSQPLANVIVYGKKNILKIYELMYKDSTIHLERKRRVFIKLKAKPNLISESKKWGNNPNGKLSVDQVVKIKRKINDGMRLVDIAKEFNVSRCTIGDIKRGKTWGYIR
jgi:hypothetical protein